MDIQGQDFDEKNERLERIKEKRKFKRNYSYVPFAKKNLTLEINKDDEEDDLAFNPTMVTLD
jgi:hypothetical protein